MKKFLVLYQSEAALNGMSVSEMFAKTTPEQMKAGMAAWQRWLEKCGSALLDSGTPLDKSTKVTAGSAVPDKTLITGYSIIQAASMEEAASLMNGHPHLYMPGASVEILECFPMPGF